MNTIKATETKSLRLCLNDDVNDELEAPLPILKQVMVETKIPERNHFTLLRRLIKKSSNAL